jgi:hypothetical protein
VKIPRMKYWIAKLVIFIALLYNLLLVTDYAGASELSNIDVQSLNVLPVVETDFSRDLENLSLNLSPTRRETLNLPSSLVGKGVRGLGFLSAFPHDVKSQVVENLASADNNFGNSKKEDFRRFTEIVKKSNKLEGLFTVYDNDDSGKIYWEIKPEQLNKNYLATVTLESGVGESGIYSGLPLSDFLFYFRRVNNKLHFVVRNVKFRTESRAEERSLARSFSDSVLYSLEINSIHPRSKNIFIDLDGLLMQDFPD